MVFILWVSSFLELSNTFFSIFANGQCAMVPCIAIKKHGATY